MPYKISVWIVLFLVAFNAGHVMLGASGTYDYLGVNPNPGAPSEVEDAANTAQQFSGNPGAASTLFQLYNAIAGPLETIFNAVLPGFAMLKNVGVPAYLVNWIIGPVALIPGIDLINFFRSG